MQLSLASCVATGLVLPAAISCRAMPRAMVISCAGAPLFPFSRRFAHSARLAISAYVCSTRRRQPDGAGLQVGSVFILTTIGAAGRNILNCAARQRRRIVTVHNSNAQSRSQQPPLTNLSSNHIHSNHTYHHQTQHHHHPLIALSPNHHLANQTNQRPHLTSPNKSYSTSTPPTPNHPSTTTQTTTHKHLQHPPPTPLQHNITTHTKTKHLSPPPPRAPSRQSRRCSSQRLR